MQPPLTTKELAKLYPHLTVEQRLEMEEWHRGWIHNIMIGQATSEEYKAAMPPYPEEVHSRKPKKCPKCGANSVVEIIGGYPGPELLELEKQGKLILGGCCHDPGPDASWECTKCHQQIWKTGWDAEISY